MNDMFVNMLEHRQILVLRGGSIRQKCHNQIICCAFVLAMANSVSLLVEAFQVSKSVDGGQFQFVNEVASLM